MGSFEFLRIAFHDDPVVRRDKFTEAYRQKQVDGLHYLVMLDGGAVALRRPDFTLHDEITHFLSVLRRRRPNTRNRYAQALKKFADFCLVWGVEPGGPVPLEPLLRGFADYVKVLHPKPMIRNRLDWVTVRTLPLHPVFGPAVLQLEVREKDGVVVAGMSRSQVYDCLSFTLTYLRWISRAKARYEHLEAEIAKLPTRTVTRRSLIAGTAGATTRTVTDIAELAGVFHPHLESAELRPDTIFTDEEVAELYGAADPSRSGTYRDQFILALMEGVGIRRTAVVNIRIRPESLPVDAGRMVSEGPDGLRDRLKGDLEWVRYPTGHRWVLTVRPHKGKPSYSVSYEFNQGPFTQALFLWMTERQAIMATSGQPDHGYLFVGLSRTNRGRPLREGAINLVFNRLLERVRESTGRDLKQERDHATPHGMRHKFVTNELTVAGRSVPEVQKRVGHKVGGTTLVETYYHWVQNRRTVPEQAHSLRSMLELWRELDLRLRGGQ
ncbi:MAG TPA: site-specific integrase [Symbiobacteriaceae bacterium]|jgi:hypothetical protein